MRLNTLSPAPGHKTPKKRVGRGIGSGLGKTCGKGHKGQKARKSGNVRPGFEGGQMPLQKRLPKYGFTSRTAQYVQEIRTSELNKIEADVVDLITLRHAGLISGKIISAKVFLSGQVSKSLVIRGIQVSAGAKMAIEAAGGSVEI
jgi:large subunit ribosomal protein L15